jgi:hypothetical protein
MDCFGGTLQACRAFYMCNFNRFVTLGGFGAVGRIARMYWGGRRSFTLWTLRVFGRFESNFFITFSSHSMFNRHTPNWLSFLNCGVAGIEAFKKGHEGTGAKVDPINSCTINDLQENGRVSLFFAFIVCF